VLWTKGFRAKKVVAITSNYAPPEVAIRSYPDSPICDVVVVVRDQEVVLRCPDCRQAMRWARLECKSYKIPEPDIDVGTKGEPATYPFSGVQIEIDLCSARTQLGLPITNTAAQPSNNQTGTAQSRSSNVNISANLDDRQPKRRETATREFRYRLVTAPIGCPQMDQRRRSSEALTAFSCRRFARALADVCVQVESNTFHRQIL
jgi:hypothetical protein